MELLFWCYTSIHESSSFNKTFSCVHDPSEPLNRIQNVWNISVGYLSQWNDSFKLLLCGTFLSAVWYDSDSKFVVHMSLSALAVAL